MTIFGGSYFNVGQEARDFTINPFSPPQTKETLQSLFSFFRVLIDANEHRLYRLDFKDVMLLSSVVGFLIVFFLSLRRFLVYCWALLLSFWAMSFIALLRAS
jgi:hypothetical protein